MPILVRKPTLVTLGIALLEKVKPLSIQVDGEDRKPGEVPAWSRQAGHLTIRDGIVGHCKYYRNGPGRVLGRLSGIRSICEYDINVEAHQLSRKDAGTGSNFTVGIPVFNDEIFSFDIAKITEALLKCS